MPKDTSYMSERRDQRMALFATEGMPLSRGLVKTTDPQGRKVTRSARLNPGLAFVADANAIPDVTEEELNGMFAGLKIDSSGGKRHQRGGAMTYAEKLKYAKAVAMMLVYNTGFAAQAGSEAAAPYVKDYLKSRFITPLYPATSRTAGILIGLADQIVKSGVTVVNLSVSSSAYTANVVSKIIQKFNEWGTTMSAKLVSDEYAQAAADAAVETVKDRAVAAGVGVFVANQIGLLPMSAVLAAILFTLKINLGSGPGRAYVVTSFYTWFLQQNEGDQKAIVDAAKEYATTAGEGAKGAAAKLGPLLVKAGSGAAAAGAGAQNAFAAIATAVRGQSVDVRAPAPANDAPAEALLVAAAPSAAEAVAVPSILVAAAEVAAAEVAAAPASRARRGKAALSAASSLFVPTTVASGDGAPMDTGAVGPPPPQSGVGRRKTKKRAVKRRVTRRRKAQKILGTPVFIY